MLEEELLQDERAHRVPEHDDGKARVTLGDFAIHAMRIFDDSIPTVAVGHVPRGTPVGNAVAVPAMIVRVRRVPGSSEGLRKTRIPGPVLRHPV